MHFFEFLFILTQEDKNLSDPSSPDVTVPHAVTHICLHICNSVTRIIDQKGIVTWEQGCITWIFIKQYRIYDIIRILLIEHRMFGIDLSCTEWYPYLMTEIEHMFCCDQSEVT